LDGGVVTPGTDWKPATVLRRTRRQQRNVAWIDRWSDIVVDNPTSGHFHRKPFVIWLRVGLPVSPHEPKPMPTGDGLEFLHCPSMPTLKGSDRITLAVEAVAATGRAVALRTLTNVPNTTVRQALDECAGVIDQAYSDYAMPGFATESAWHARPVIIAGYAVEHWERWLPEDARPPTLFVHPDAIERTLTQLVDDPAERQATGLRAREFVSNNWRPDLVARRMLRLLEGDVPSEWLFDPNNTDYVHGCGLSEEAAIAAGRRLLERYGPDAFCVNDKPALRQLLVEFYGKERTPLRVD
jgi:hypothetical protein